jgi:hypothetical protein
VSDELEALTSGELTSEQARALVAAGVTWAQVWAALQEKALDDGEWAGYPQLCDTLPLVLERRYPHRKFAGMTVARLRESETRACSDEEVREDQFVRNEWLSRARGYRVMLVQDGPTVRLVVLPAGAPAARRLTMMLNMFDATRVWTLEAEIRAMAKLSELVPLHIWQMYMLTGQFLETSPRSGVTYVFRRLRPTVALRPKAGLMQPLAALCLHPIGYYDDSWAGVMVPTDDVIAHLVLMRGDEHRFWRQANQIPINEPEAGV